MNTFKKITVGFASSVVLCFAASCSQNDVVATKPEMFSVLPEKTSVAWKNLQNFSFAQENRALNKDLEALAKSVARTLRNSTVQKELHKKVMVKFDGDTEILWTALNADQTMTNTLRSAGVSDNGQWTNAVAQNGTSFGINSGEEITTLLQKSKQQYFANVHLYWHRAETWDKTSTPLVTYIPTGIDLEKEKIYTLTAYDADGNMYEVDAETAKKHPVIVIGPNERTNMDGSLVEGLALTNTQRLIEKNSAKLNSATTLSLEWLSMQSSWADELFEGWFWGQPEFYARLFSATSSSSAAFELGYWSFAGQIEGWQCDGRVLGGWTGGRAKSLYWDTNVYRTIVLRWFEHDPGSSMQMTSVHSYQTAPGATSNLTASFWLTHSTDILDAMTINADSPTRYFGSGNPFAMFSF